MYISSPAKKLDTGLGYCPISSVVLYSVQNHSSIRHVGPRSCVLLWTIFDTIGDTFIGIHITDEMDGVVEPFSWTKFSGSFHIKKAPLGLLLFVPDSQAYYLISRI
jgi:hypothetical protein